MIIKGASRAGPKQLAAHLGRTDTNERVEVLELQSPAGTLRDAFRDWQTIAEGTRGKLGLYHANIDPDARYKMTAAQWTRAVDVLEAELGLTGQPRAVVMHEKNGRQHIHVVWQRADVQTMTLRSDSQNYQAHERASHALEREFGHEHVPGKHTKRDRAKQAEMPDAQIDHAEWQQGQGGGLDHKARKAQVTALFRASDNGAAFRAALEAEGYVLARGDKRDFVILDGDAKAHSLGRQLPGVKVAELRDFMSDVNAASLPSVKEARAEIRARPSPEPLQDIAQQQADPADKRLADLLAAIAERAYAQRAEQDARHGCEIDALQKTQQAEATKALDAFARKFAKQAAKERPAEPIGMAKLWRDIREAVSAEARTEREATEASRADALDARREEGLRLVLSGLEAKHRTELDRMVERQGRERAEMLRAQEKEAEQRLADDRRARALEREYELRRLEALERDREGPERGDRAR